MTEEMQRIPADTAYHVVVQCPHCGAGAVVPLALASKLERLKGESRLSLRVKQQKVDHVCGQTALIADTGEIISLDERRQP
jgi:hypothetical protein